MLTLVSPVVKKEDAKMRIVCNAHVTLQCLYPSYWLVAGVLYSVPTSLGLIQFFMTRACRVSQGSRKQYSAMLRRFHARRGHPSNQDMVIWVFPCSLRMKVRHRWWVVIFSQLRARDYEYTQNDCGFDQDDAEESGGQRPSVAACSD